MENSSKSGVKRLKYSRLTSGKINKILKCFCEDLTATQTARLTGVNRNTVNRYYNEIRAEILVNSSSKAVFGAAASLNLTKVILAQREFAENAEEGRWGKLRFSEC